MGAKNESGAEAKKDPGFESEILETKYHQRETRRIKGFDGLKGHCQPYFQSSKQYSQSIMAVNPPKRRSERLNRRKWTLINKCHELAEFCDVDVALIIRNRKTGRYFTYNSVDLESWPPPKEQIVSHYPWFWRFERTLLTDK